MARAGRRTAAALYSDRQSVGLEGSCVTGTLDTTVRGVRRDASVDVAEHLIRTKGYERMSIQDVQDALGVSRGAIYHYFSSKATLLEAVVERMVEAIMAVLAPIAEDPQLLATTKLQGVFSAAGRWKAERRELMVALLEAWYSDHNAIVREHVKRAASLRLTPLLAEIVRRGTSEGSFSVTSPEHAAGILVALLAVSGDAMSQLFLDRLAGRVPFQDVEHAVDAYDEAVERILGLPMGSFRMIDEATLRFWFA
jgi:AcrR family transcriptional regulator